MKKFSAIVSLELKSLARSGLLAALLVVSLVWMLVSPLVIKGDGTAEGARELYIRFSLGGVFVLLAIALVSSATGSVAAERAAKRLQLTLVRPVNRFLVALGKVCANVFAGALVLFVSATVLAFRVDVSRHCNHVVSPIMPSPAEEAKTMYEHFMNDPSTPIEVKRAKKKTVMRLLTQRAVDNYQTVTTNETASWRFLPPEGESVSVRMRFTNQFDMRQELLGEFVFDGKRVAVTNITQAVLTVPIEGCRISGAGTERKLEFRNLGKTALMLRPRKDLGLLVEADGFLSNLFRAWVELCAILALLVSAGIFLSSGLGRPVALFVAISVILVGEMSPSVIQQYPDELETKRIDRIGLVLTRFSAEITKPFSSLSPMESLSKDECVEPDEVGRVLAVNCFAMPIVFCLLAAVLMPYKQE